MLALFKKTTRCVIPAGMDGIPMGRDPRMVESIARGLDVEWDQETIDKYQFLEELWLENEYDRIEQQRQKSKVKK